MCRQIGIITTSEEHKTPLREILLAFKKLAANGCIPKGFPPGHGDGWGVATLGEANPRWHRSVQSAATDPSYLTLIEEVAITKPKIVLAHLRKAFIGEVATENCQPFKFDGALFAHNGSIIDHTRIPLPEGTWPQLAGNTDSEKLFAHIRLLQAGHKLTPAKALRVAALNIAGDGLRYTALNTLIAKDGLLLGSRIVNTRSLEAEQECHRYYTLYHGDSGKGFHILCSEPLREMQGIEWRLIPNGTIIQVQEKVGVSEFKI
ncbi:MAG: hypothetical protein COU11_04575 [Candidatus Harrisonbacteria bacterium CG10_big_fil_rev_8_21_14_0_10_49_15]|uniref:Glutamine amidotransferase type-2 domain-containing protein n=1 Tax=Candidatus Harrisonbacteria bacterium CG10_big_fil_rev_8_21_14_0_10_49_15 TaxID=1974587 RepID=A0A2H0UK25_9BACT|nr:MAG: hypothetical protein COU11_04575 [Candidatus Harrisonbacteria bacterium CG10_big_fil_rev_8_21_14_0_10_49_15]